MNYYKNASNMQQPPLQTYQLNKPQIPNEKMTMDTVTLGHFPAPVVTAEDVATVKAAGKAAISGTKAFGTLSVF